MTRATISNIMMVMKGEINDESDNLKHTGISGEEV